MFKYKGVVYKVGNLEVISEKFSKRELVLTDGAEQYPQFISFTFVKDKCALLDGVGSGQEVEVSAQQDITQRARAVACHLSVGLA